MRWIELVEPYFRGEKLEALVFILPLGLASLVFGAWLLTDLRDAFSRGVAIPCLLLGLVLTFTGATVGLRSPAQADQVLAAAQADPAAAQQAELARMQKVNANWPIFLGAWATFTAAGLILRFAVRNDMAQGAAVALVFYGGVGMIIDGFAERRARPYTAALEGKEP